MRVISSLEQNNTIYWTGVYIAFELERSTKERLQAYQNRFLNFIKKEYNLHCTLIYAPRPYFDANNQLGDFVASNLAPFRYEGTLGKLSIFGDSLVVELDSPELQAIHTDLSERFNLVSMYPEYKPHITLGTLFSKTLPQLPKMPKDSSMNLAILERVSIQELQL